MVKLFLKRCIAPDIISLNYSISFPEIYNLLIEYKTISENFNFIKTHFKYLCNYGINDKLKLIFDNSSSSTQIINYENAYIAFKYGANITIIKNFLNLFNDLDFYLITVLMDNKNNLFFEALEYIQYKFPEFYKSIDYLELFKCSCLKNKPILCSLLYEKYKGLVTPEFLKHLFYNVVRRYNVDIIKFLLNIIKDQNLKKYFTEICCMYLKDINLLYELISLLDFDVFKKQNLMNVFMVSFSHKKNIIKSILYPDLQFYIQSF
jgi:hypothetical protein